jgi:hypothetical protein
MKKQHLFIFLFVLLIVPRLSNAQYKPFAFGFKVGPGLGWLKTDTKDYTGGSSLGFSWGITGEFNISESYCVSTGVNFIYNNSKLHFLDLKSLTPASPVEEVKIDRKQHVKYLQIPVTLKMRTNEVGKKRFFGQFGLGSAFRLNAKGKDEYELSGSLYNETSNIDNQVAFIRESLIVGIGMEYHITSGNIVSAGLTLDNGFTDVLSDKNNVDPTLKPKATTSFVELSIGLLF